MPVARRRRCRSSRPRCTRSASVAVDVLEVHVDDALGVRPRSARPGRRRRRAGGRCRGRARRGEPASTRSVSSPALDHRADVGVQGARPRRGAAARSVIRSRLSSSVCQPASSRTGRSSYPSTPVAAASTTTPAPAARQSSMNAVDLGQRVVARVVQHDGHEAADRGQPVVGRAARRAPRASGEEAVRAELGRGEAERAHLLEHRRGVELVAPARDLADSPGDRGARDAVADGDGTGGWAAWVGRPASWLRLSSHARTHVKSLSRHMDV